MIYIFYIKNFMIYLFSGYIMYFVYKKCHDIYLFSGYIMYYIKNVMIFYVITWFYHSNSTTIIKKYKRFIALFFVFLFLFFNPLLFIIWRLYA